MILPARVAHGVPASAHAFGASHAAFGSMPLDWSAQAIGSRLAGAARSATTLAPEDRPMGAALPGRIVPAAVLVALVVGEGVPRILLTKRTAHLRAHAGQIAFPGGRIEPDDGTAEAAALREAEEEVGLCATHVTVLGRLPSHVTGTGFRIEPVVGLVAADASFRPDPNEVEEAFELPAASLWDLPGPSRQPFTWGGASRMTWVVPHDRHLIWGATATILVGLARALGGASDRAPAGDAVPGSR